jgi:hypothetical protein
MAGVLFAAVTWWVFGTPIPGRPTRHRLSPVVETEEPTIVSIDPEPAAEREIYRAKPSSLYTRSAGPADLAEPVWSSAPSDIPATATSLVAAAPSSVGALGLGEDGLPQWIPPLRG